MSFTSSHLLAQYRSFIDSFFSILSLCKVLPNTQFAYNTFVTCRCCLFTILLHKPNVTRPCNHITVPPMNTGCFVRCCSHQNKTLLLKQN